MGSRHVGKATSPKMLYGFRRFWFWGEGFGAFRAIGFFLTLTLGNTRRFRLLGCWALGTVSGFLALGCRV